MKCVFKGIAGDDFAYSYEVIVPFECEDLDKVKLDMIEKLQQSENGFYGFGCYIKKNHLEY